jgi:hypothetical protein
MALHKVYLTEQQEYVMDRYFYSKEGSLRLSIYITAGDVDTNDREDEEKRKEITEKFEKYLNKQLKDIIKIQPFFLKMFEKFNIPIDMLDNLTFQIKELKNRNAQSDSKTIIFDEKLFDKKDFIKEKLHFLVHELCHWLTRQRERNFYFADPEETDAFSIGMAYELLRGRNKEEVLKIYYPIIEKHFNDGRDANKMFVILFNKALDKVKEYK